MFRPIVSHSLRLVDTFRPSSDGGGNGAGSLMHSLEGTRDRANEGGREGGKGHEMSFCGGGGRGGGRKRKMKVARASNHGSLARSVTLTYLSQLNSLFVYNITTTALSQH